MALDHSRSREPRPIVRGPSPTAEPSRGSLNVQRVFLCSRRKKERIEGRNICRRSDHFLPVGPITHEETSCTVYEVSGRGGRKKEFPPEVLPEDGLPFCGVLRYREVDSSRFVDALARSTGPSGKFPRRQD